MAQASGAGVLGSLSEDIVVDQEYILPGAVMMSKVFDLRGMQAVGVFAGLSTDISEITGVYAGNEADGSDMVKCEGVENIGAINGQAGVRLIDVKQLRSEYMRIEVDTQNNAVHLIIVGYRVRQAPVPETRHDDNVKVTATDCLCAPAPATS